MPQKNDVVELTAHSLGTQGEGVCASDGLNVFVPYLLPGERALVKLLKVKGGVAYGKIEELLVPAEERVRPKCPVFFRCGGCQFQHLRYREQLAFKTRLVRDTLKKIGGVETDVLPCERSEREYGYRNKLQLPVGRQDGRNVIGFYAERSHRIVPTAECPIHPAWSKSLIAALYDFMDKCGLDGYDERTGRGHIRHIVVRELKRKYLVVLVTAVRELKGIDYFAHLLDAIFPEDSLFLNFNDKETNVVFGEEFHLVRGKASYECREAGISYEAGPNTFVQVNDGVRAKLYEHALSLVGRGPVVDCYAGGGLLTALFAEKCGRAAGIEVVPEAHACAERLKEKNGLEGRMENFCGKVEDLLGGVLLNYRGAAVVLDPPRAGVGRSVIRTLLAEQPKTIVMISCDPATLARDLGLLTGTLEESETGELKRGKSQTGYEIVQVKPFDMFPQTRHIETVVLLEKRESNI